MTAQGVGALVGALVCLAASPYLARLTLSVPDRENHHWWRGRAVTGRRIAGRAVVATGLGALSGAAAGWSALLPAFLALAVLGAPLVVIDLEVHRLPNRLVFPAAGAAALLGMLAAALRPDWSALLHGVEGAAAVFVVLLALRLISPRSFGYGDVKLGAVLGGYLGWFGWLFVFYGIFAGFLLGAVASVALVAARRATMRSAVPFGPALIVGPVLVLALRLVPSAG